MQTEVVDYDSSSTKVYDPTALHVLDDACASHTIQTTKDVGIIGVGRY